MMRTIGQGLEAEAVEGRRKLTGTTSPSPAMAWVWGMRTSLMGCSIRLGSTWVSTGDGCVYMERSVCVCVVEE